MIFLAFAVTLATLPAPAAPSSTASPVQTAPDPAPASPSPEDTLAGLQQVYSTTCGQTGILYHAYDELCEGVRKQISAYQKKMERDAAKARQAAEKGAP